QVRFRIQPPTGNFGCDDLSYRRRSQAQAISGREAATLMAAKPATDIGAGAAHDHRYRNPSRDGEIGARAASARAEEQLAALGQIDRSPSGNRDAFDMRIDLGTGDRDPRSSIE